jgi:hypothetical protein
MQLLVRRYDTVYAGELANSSLMSIQRVRIGKYIAAKFSDE